MLSGPQALSWLRGRRVSVAAILVATIVCIVTVLLAIVGTLASHYYSAERRQTFADRIELAADQLASALAPPVWNLEYAQIGQLAHSRLRDPSIFGIVLEVDTRTLVFGRDDSGRPQDLSAPYPAAGLPVERRPITFEGERVGTLTLHASPHLLEAELARNRLYMVAFALVLDIVLILSLYVVVKHLVIRPLRQVERYADEISNTSDSSSALGDLRFLGELDGLKHSIDQMVRKLAAHNRELARTNARFERVTRQFPLPIRIADNDGRILLLNESFTATFGYTEDDLPDLQTWYGKTYPDEDHRSQALEAWRRAVTDAPGTGGRIKAGIFRITCKDGSVKAVDTAGVQFEDLTVGVMQDVTERMRAEEELARHREHLEELVHQRTEELAATYRRLEETQFAMDHAGIAIQWYEAGSGRITYVNDHACRLYGYDRERLLGRSITELAPAIDPGDERSTGHTRIETTVRRGDGTQLAVEFAIYRQAADAARTGDFISFTTDISQRKEAEQALITARIDAETAATARSQFLANMSHEIRTPMNAIIGMTQLALQSELAPRQHNFIQKANAAALSLLGIINDILDFSKVESGNLRIEHVDVDLDRVFDELAGLLGLKAEEKALELLFDLAPDLPRRIVGDPLRLKQVLTNLADNAIKFTRHGHVIVRCRHVQTSGEELVLRFEVEDSGIGMDAEQMSRLFAPFSQGDGSISRRFGGTGLGLAISRRLIELMGGAIEVHSRPGEGSRFAFTVHAGLPRGAAAAPRAPAIPRGLRVLVVDDHPDAREVLAAQLAAMQIEVASVACGRDALERLQDARPFELLITDWHMPGMDGVELVRAIQQRPDLVPPRAIIMVSAYGTEALRAACAGVRIAAILPKPVSPSTLLDAIQSALGAQQAAGALPRTAVPPPASARPLRGLRILLVEDNPINQELALEMLDRAGARVATATDGEEALQMLARDAAFDCVLMDVQMPRMDGLEATRRLRAQARFADLPVIAMTAGALPEERAQTLAAGMNDHLSKPIDVDLMLATILRWSGRGHHEAPAPAGTAPAPAEDAPAVLDFQRGLKIANDEHEIYRRLLALHAGSSARIVARLREAAAAGERGELAALAHRIKGEAATLGALEARACAAQLESRCRGDGATPPAAEVERLCAALERLRAHIDGQSAPIPPSAVETDVEALDLLLSTLRRQLEAGDTDALESVSALCAQLPAAQAERRFSRLARLVDNYAFDEALEELDRALADPAAGEGAPAVTKEARR